MLYVDRVGWYELFISPTMLEKMLGLRGIPKTFFPKPFFFKVNKKTKENKT